MASPIVIRNLSASQSTYICRACRHSIRQAQSQQKIDRRCQTRRASTIAQPSTTRNTRTQTSTTFADEENNNQKPTTKPTAISRVAQIWSKATKPLTPEPKPAPVAAKPEDDYTPAKTWDDLDFIGFRPTDWKDVPANANAQYKPWTQIAPERTYTRSELVTLLHQSMYTAVTGKAVLRKLDALFANMSLEALQTLTWSTDEHDGTDKISSSSPEIQKKLDQRMQQAGNDAKSQMPVSATSITSIASKDQSFLDQKFEINKPFTFQVIKTLFHTLQRPIPDMLLNKTIRNLSPTWSLFLTNLHEHLKPDPRQLKLASRLLANSSLQKQPNVIVFPRRVTSVDKEVEVGRWKVIVEELERRGLPVLGKVKAVRDD